MIARGIVLQNSRVRLEPLDFTHATDLYEAGKDERIWEKTYRGHPMSSLNSTFHYIGEALYGTVTAPGGVPFAIIDKPANRAIGGTRFFDIDTEQRRLEIGWTWLSRAHWRTDVNTNCKLLLLTHAFEVAGVNRVQFKADTENVRSCAAIARIGAVYEGMFREVRFFEGCSRSASCYSILASEWPSAKEHLVQKLRHL